MAATRSIVFFALLAGCYAQRSPYAGRNPIGYPRLEVTTASTTTVSSLNALGNKFGENQTTTTTTTQRLPLEALGDRDLVNRLGQLPVDKQPFWFINWQELEKHRTRPHTFDQKPNIFNPNSVQEVFNSQPQQNTNNQVRPQQNVNNQATRQQQNVNNQATRQQQNINSQAARPQQNLNNQAARQQQNVNNQARAQQFTNQGFQQQNAINNQRAQQQQNLRFNGF